ncbi:MAG TPA: hypothetical protein VHZ50_17960 [Puia sp.]|nr:hypothetical protein [Puia sp.]
MKSFLIAGLLIFVLGNLNAQIEQSHESPSQYIYFNNFQTYTNEKPNADSAFYYAQKLASDEKYFPLLKNLIHDAFAQAFIHQEINNTDDVKVVAYKTLAKEILAKMVSDTTTLLFQTIHPMYLWIQIQNNKTNLSALTNLTNEFIKEELSSKTFIKTKPRVMVC